MSLILDFYIMRNNIYVPIPGKEDLEAAKRRREDYALFRDQQAEEYNEAIAKRYADKKDEQTVCIKCGKEFTAPSDSSIELCPECR